MDIYYKHIKILQNVFCGIFLPLTSLNMEIASSECFCLADMSKHRFLNSTVIFAREHICTFKNEASCPETAR